MARERVGTRQSEKLARIGRIGTSLIGVLLVHAEQGRRPQCATAPRCPSVRSYPGTIPRATRGLQSSAAPVGHRLPMPIATSP